MAVFSVKVAQQMEYLFETESYRRHRKALIIHIQFISVDNKNTVKPCANTLFIFRSLSCFNVDDFNNRNLFFTAKLFKQGYIYHQIRKAFFKFNTDDTQSLLLNTTLVKTLQQQGISEPIFYGGLVYKFKRIVGKPNFCDQFKKIIKRYKNVGYIACLVLNPITVYSYGFLFNCTTVGQASDSMTALT